MITITTECEHSFDVSYALEELSGATMDCKECGQLLLLPLGLTYDVLPQKQNPGGTVVRALLFHKEMNRQDPAWPADGHGTGVAEF
jgi:hypothetical protein